MIRNVLKVSALALALLAPAFAAPVRVAAQSAAAASGGVPATFTLRAGDVIELFHWREELMSGEYPVEADGRVTLPLLGPRNVVDRPWIEVRDSLRAAYGRELRDADLRMVPKRRVFVLGFVQEPGIQLADPTMSISGAIALAGGASADGDLRRVRVVRDGVVLANRASIESALVSADVRSGDQIFVDRRGWFDRNSPFFVSAMVGLAGIAVTLIVSR